MYRPIESGLKYISKIYKSLGVRTVGPVNNEVPESAMAEQPLEQNPGGL